MKSISLHQMTRRLSAVMIFGTVSLLSPLVAFSSEPLLPGPGQRETGKPVLNEAAKVNSRASVMEKRWQQLQQVVQPDTLIQLSDQFSTDFPNSRYAQANSKIRAGAEMSLRAQQEARLSSEGLVEANGNRRYRNELIQAMRGSKDSAYRIATMYRNGTNGLPKDRRRNKQWLRIAAELGMGKASWEVANIYNRDGEMADAAHFEAKAVKDGFTIPPRLPTRNMSY